MPDKPAQCFAYRPITDAPDTFLLDMCNDDGRLTAESVAKAASEFAKPKMSGPEGEIINEDVPAVRDRIAAAWQRVAKDTPLPDTLKASEDEDQPEYDSFKTFLSRLYGELKGKVDADAWANAVKTARSHAGGKAPRRKVAMSETLTEDDVDRLIGAFLEDHDVVEAEGDDVVELREWLMGSEPEYAMVDDDYLPLNVMAHRFAAGGMTALISTFGKWAGGSQATCASILSKKGFQDPDALCAWLKDRYTGSTSWRGDDEKKSKKAAEPTDHRSASELSLNDIQHKIHQALNPSTDHVMGLGGVERRDYFWVRDIYDDYVIFSNEGDDSTYRQSYAVVDGKIQLLGERSPVREVRQYVPASPETETYAELGSSVLSPGFHLNVSLQSYAEPPEWIPYLPIPGEYTHPRYGKISVDKDRNQKFVDNFVAAVWQKELPIDLEHNYKFSGAAGWVKELRLNDDGSVDARVEWTDLGEEAIKRDRFKFFSPEWHESWTHPITQQVHTDVAVGGALCTKPFFKHDALRPLVASERVLYVFAEDQASFTPDTAFTRLAGAAAEASRQEDPVADTVKTVALTEEEYNSLKDLPARFAEEQTARQAAEARLEQIETERRTQRFTDMVTGKGGPTDGARWVGDVKKHVAHLESLAKTFGEDSEEFTFHVETQRQIAVASRQSSVFSELGKTGGEEEPQDGWTRANRMASEMVEADKTGTLTHDVALEKVFEMNPRLFNEAL